MTNEPNKPEAEESRGQKPSMARIRLPPVGYLPKIRARNGRGRTCKGPYGKSRFKLLKEEIAKFKGAHENDK